LFKQELHLSETSGGTIVSGSYGSDTALVTWHKYNDILSIQRPWFMWYLFVLMNNNITDDVKVLKGEDFSIGPSARGCLGQRSNIIVDKYVKGRNGYLARFIM
jgi:hypothetical protein